MLLKRKGELHPIKSLVPIAVGVGEARSIISALQGFDPQRPMTHDLCTNIMTTLHATLKRVDIHSFHDETFFAALTLVQNGVTFIVDARPSDAVALAVRQNVPIYLDQDVFNASSVETTVMSITRHAGMQQAEMCQSASPATKETLTQIQNFSKHVQPSDFKVP